MEESESLNSGLILALNFAVAGVVYHMLAINSYGGLKDSPKLLKLGFTLSIVSLIIILTQCISYWGFGIDLAHYLI